jgi:hypothetical protein
MARKKKVVVQTLADLIAKHSVSEEGFAIKQGYEDIQPEELIPFQEIIEEQSNESTTN